MTLLTAGKSQAGFEFARVNEKSRQLEGVRARSEVVALPAHSVPQAQILGPKSRKEYRRSQLAEQKCWFFQNAIADHAQVNQ